MVHGSRLNEIKVTAGRVAAVLSQAETGGKLREFYTKSRDHKALRAWLQRQAVDWALKPLDGSPDPLVTMRSFDLLFDPGVDSRGWFNRQMLLIAVLEDLHRRGWRPSDGEQVVQEMAEDMDPDEEAVADSEGEP